MSKHRASSRQVRRSGRVGVLALALGVTIVVGGLAVGVLPQLKADRAAADVGARSSASVEATKFATVTLPEVEAPAAVAAEAPTTASVTSVVAVPKDSGEGRRIVFAQSDQRVWLIGADGAVDRTYLVSGSRFDNLQPGSFTVLSRSRHAAAFDYSGTLEYFVRFATGYSEPIGFHAVPRYNNGKLEQTKAQLGTPLSAGCVRQWMPDAIALWDFAPVGTKVIVTA